LKAEYKRGVCLAARVRVARIYRSKDEDSEGFS
jgi:hypothetical protein